MHPFSPSLACARHTASLKASALPDNVRDAAHRLLLDWLGCALKGAARSEAAPVRAIIREQGGHERCTIMGEARKGTMAQAALCHGWFGHILEMDDVDRQSISHPGTVTIPAVLAAGEAVGASGLEALAAMAAGYEVMLRIGAAVTPAHYQLWHTTATAGVFGAAMASGRLLGLDENRLRGTLGSAGTMSAGLWQFLADEGMSKVLHTGTAAANGVLAALLASHGHLGAGHILEGPQGFFAAYARQEVDGNLFADFGQRHRITEVSIKPYPCCRHTHSAIDAALALCEQAAGEPLAEVNALCYATALRVAGNNAPNTPLEAKFSLTRCVALALLHGRPDETIFARFDEPAVRELAAVIRAVVCPKLDARHPQAWPCRLEARTVSGRLLHSQVDAPKGDPENPLSWEEVLHKFRDMTCGLLSEERQERLVDLCTRFDELPSCTLLTQELGEALRAAPSFQQA